MVRPSADFKLEKGHSYRTSGGTTGQIRSFDEGRRLRLTWQPADWAKPSTLQIYLLPQGSKTSLRFHQEKLAGTKERGQMRRHWQKVLAGLEQLLAK